MRFAEPGDAFEFGAPTTARNASRTLRAMQLRRAILLEGSPGVGKTALVAALASRTGSHLFAASATRSSSDIAKNVAHHIAVQTEDP